MRSIDFKLQNLKKVYIKLLDACDRYDGIDEFIRDSVIQRFEFTYELCHKTLREFMKYMGAEPDNAFPRYIFKEAYSNGIIDDEDVWLSMIEDRNRTSHVYSENMSDRIAERIKNEYVYAIGKVIKNIEENL
ncbi:MAG TPA: nucleotidyltransferase substrate binding protein [Candidatus Ornithomonoglobus merdipullorum]|uniref:Nucleotidyltransferase substrate binding protein n=1 Tax=Candidatus Ornithomonoglobus merdipullorum TaxID=2840895 RepID=A0A9D1MAU1_9FIRM|nr:nucleotidyltransferase substrate binding protein [Candidatus Ornithomonoglobus merdipullorum]